MGGSGLEIINIAAKGLFGKQFMALSKEEEKQLESFWNWLENCDLPKDIPFTQALTIYKNEVHK
jgi:hypothetical protein